MLAYAANRPVVGKAPSSPSAMLLIISAHVALIALVMSAKMEFSPQHREHTTIDFVRTPPPPPPAGTTVKRTTHTDEQQVTHTQTETKLPPVGSDALGGTEQSTGGEIDLGGGGLPYIPPQPPLPVRHEASLLTRPNELKPPYPESKILSEEEATLQLRLMINDAGRVTAVDPIGPADRVFLDAARRYLIAHWRYRPATEDGHAISSSVVISLSFRLDG